MKFMKGDWNETLNLQVNTMTELSRTTPASQRGTKLQGNLEKHTYLEKTNF